MKVIGITDNYTSQAAAPSVFLMSDSSLLKDNKPFFIPDFAEKFTFSTSIVIRINRLGKNIARKFAPRYYDAATVGLSLKAEGLNRTFANDCPGALQYAFDGAAIIGEFVPVEQLSGINNLDFSSQIGESTVCSSCSCKMNMDFDALIEYISQYFTLKIGDMIFTGAPSGVSPALAVDTCVSATLDGRELLNFRIK